VNRWVEVVGRIPIPGAGAFDHAAVHLDTGQVFVADTGAGTLEVLDPEAMAVLTTIEDCPGASGVVCDSEHALVAAASRTGGHVLLIDATSLEVRSTIQVGPAPNGLAFDVARQRVLVADVEADQALLIDTVRGEIVASCTLPGRPRWVVHDPRTKRFYLNIASPAQVLVRDAETLAPAGSWEVMADGPPGLDLDQERRLLLVACDGGVLVGLDADRGAERNRLSLPGPPDVIFFNPVTDECYVGVGDPGVLRRCRYPNVERHRRTGHRCRCAHVRIRSPPTAPPHPAACLIGGTRGRLPTGKTQGTEGYASSERQDCGHALAASGGDS
jgi:DNA-binding beta-propeller fold protein YncE